MKKQIGGIAKSSNATQFRGWVITVSSNVKVEEILAHGFRLEHDRLFPDSPDEIRKLLGPGFDVEDQSREGTTSLCGLPSRSIRVVRRNQATVPTGRLWVAVVEHRIVPGTQTVVLFQATEPTDDEILARFRERDGLDDEELRDLSITGPFDLTHSAKTDPGTDAALKLFAASIKS